MTHNKKYMTSFVILSILLIISVIFSLYLLKELSSYQRIGSIKGSYIISNAKKNPSKAQYLVFEEQDDNTIKCTWFQQYDFYKKGTAKKLDNTHFYHITFADEKFTVEQHDDDTLYFIDDKHAVEYHKESITPTYVNEEQFKEVTPQ